MMLALVGGTGRGGVAAVVPTRDRLTLPGVVLVADSGPGSATVRPYPSLRHPGSARPGAERSIHTQTLEVPLSRREKQQ